MTDPLSCWNCGAVLDQVLLPVSRHEYCPDCAEAVHCCRLCIHFAPQLAEQCREDRADPPTSKEEANFCDFFSPRLGTASRQTAGREADAAKARLAALFGDAAGSADGPAPTDASDSPDTEATARARLEDLFGGTDDREGA